MGTEQTQDQTVDEPQVNDDGTITISKAAWENVTGAARRKDDAAKELARVRRENVLLRAGLTDLDPDKGLGKILYGYEGELTEDEAREIAAQFRGGGQEPEAESEPEVRPAEAASTAARQRVASGAQGGSGADGENPADKAMDEARKLIAEGGTHVEAIAHFITQSV